MSWSNHNDERRAAKNRRQLLGKILTGQASREDIVLDSVLYGFQDVGESSVFSEGVEMSAASFERRASLYKTAVLFREIVVTRDKDTGELIEIDWKPPIDDESPNLESLEEDDE